MSYVEESLIPGERVLYWAQVSWGIFVWPTILVGFMIWLAAKVHVLAIFIVVIFGIYIAINLIMIILTTEFALTNRRIIAKRGILRSHSIEIMLNKVESISISQSLEGFLFGFGTVTVIGSGGTRETFSSISNPKELRKRVNVQITSITPNISN